MINHKHKCIFIHIPRTGGTSVETSICGQDWWKIDNKTKHICASNARVIYKDYWNDYFKFSFVRNPWSRMVSLAKYPKMYMVKIENGKINMDEYIEKYPTYELGENYAFLNPNKKKFIPGATYLNILNEDLDFIGRTETIEEDFKFICSKLKIKKDLHHVEKSKHSDDIMAYYDDNSLQIIKNRYWKDNQKFKFKVP